MAYLKYLILFFLFACNAAFAGYAQLKPPPGWSQGMGASVPGVAATFSFGMAANGANFKGSTVLTNAALSVAGQMVVVPASMRLAANAATVAATYSFGNPLLFATLAVGSVAYNWYKESGLKVENGNWVKTDPNTCSVAPCIGYYTSAVRAPSSSPSSACQATTSYIAGLMSPYTVAFVSAVDGSCTWSRKREDGSNPGDYGVGYYATEVPVSSTTPTNVPVDKTEFDRILSTKPIPNGLPQQLPNIDWPVEVPVINPDPAISPLPAPSPAAVPRPVFVPTGNPVPTADPAIWNQPGVRVTPSPAPDSPWRVDLQPENIPQSSPTPKTPEQLNPPGAPVPGTPVLPKPDAGPGLCDQYPGIAACAPAATPQDKIDFCKENPEILACQKLDTPDVPDLENRNVDVSISPQSGWGSGAATCPAPRHLAGANVDFSFALMCDFMSGIRPILIGIAWLSAAFILLGMKGGAD